MILNIRLLASAAMAGSMVAASPANAVALLRLVNAPEQSQTIYSQVFVATMPLTTIIFGGYNLPSFSQATQITLTVNGIAPGVAANNLLQQTWTFTPAPSGSWSDQTSGLGGYYGTNPLEFGGIYKGSYDLYSQDVPTVVGQSYNLFYLFSQDYGHSISNGFKVFEGQSVASVARESTFASAAPEPSTWMMMLAGFGLMGYGLRRRQRVLSVRPDQA